MFTDERRSRPETARLNRREFVAAAMGLAAMSAPAAGRNVTRTNLAATPGPFIEFGADRNIARERARRATTIVSSITIGGMVRRPLMLDLDDLLRRFPLEERTCRLRCVEGWSTSIPWLGFPMRTFIEWCRPTNAAKYVRFIADYDPQRTPGIAEQPWHRWPYTEAITISEAANELTLLATGMHGLPLRPEHGAPLRLVVPWKYAHKNIKSIARIEFLPHRPPTFWNSAFPHEYPFDANVNPHNPHPRWSQQWETIVESGERVRTKLFNGYADLVAGLYH